MHTNCTQCGEDVSRLLRQNLGCATLPQGHTKPPIRGHKQSHFQSFFSIPRVCLRVVLVIYQLKHIPFKVLLLINFICLVAIMYGHVCSFALIELHTHHSCLPLYHALLLHLSVLHGCGFWKCCSSILLLLVVACCCLSTLFVWLQFVTSVDKFVHVFTVVPVISGWCAHL